MPLSRLSPRSSRTTLARQKKSSRQSADAQRHLHLWSAIRKTREELDQWQRQIEQVDGLFGQHIVPLERQLTRVVADLTEQLIKHFSQGFLDIPDQSLLGLWVTDNLHSLQDHPFNDTSRTQALNQAWLDLLNNDGPVENQLARLARQHNFTANNTQQFNNEQAQDSFGTDEGSHCDHAEYEQGSNGAQSAAEPLSEHDETDLTDHDQQDTRSHQSNSDKTQTTVTDTISSLEDKLSVERLFRQLAKVLHPDREQDEQAKAAKHILMSECLKARQENDINALLNLYCEHVGELPDDLNNNSHKELISALEMQLRQLQQELRHKRFADPLQTMIVERYSSSSNADCERRILAHAKSLNEEITAAIRTVHLLDEPDGLLDALDERRAIEQDRMAINELTGL